MPPALPEKRSKRRKERQPSQYDNVPENEHLSTCSLHTSNGDSPDASKPPPLPLKKRHSKLKYNFRTKTAIKQTIIQCFNTLSLLLYYCQERYSLYLFQKVNNVQYFKQYFSTKLIEIERKS